MWPFWNDVGHNLYQLLCFSVHCTVSINWAQSKNMRIVIREMMRMSILYICIVHLSQSCKWSWSYYMITLTLVDHCTVQLCSNKDDVKGRLDAKSDCFDAFALIFFLAMSLCFMRLISLLLYICCRWCRWCWWCSS